MTRVILIALVCTLPLFSTSAFASKASVLLSLDEGGANIGGDFQLDNSNESIAIFGRFYPEDKGDGKLGRLATGGFLRLTLGGRSLSAAASMGASIISLSTIDDKNELLIGPAMSLAIHKKIDSMFFGLDHFMAYSWIGKVKGTSPIINDVMFVFGFNL